MFKNYLKITLRNIRRQKGYSVINIAGLALGMACFILIMLWVKDELSYDTFHANADTIYRVEENQHHDAGIFHVNITPLPAGPAFKAEIPEVVDAARYREIPEMLFRFQDQAFYESGIAAVDPAFFTMFTFPFIKGEMEQALVQPYSMVISEKIAQKYFADADPVGKVLSVNNQYNFTVTGVIQNIPKNSSLEFEIALPFEFLRELGIWSEHWYSRTYTTFVQLQKEASVQAVSQKMTQLLRKYNEGSTTDFVLTSLKRLHLVPSAVAYYGRPIGNIQYVYIFSLIAVFVLLIACINFMNLSTARSAARAKEIGLRKVIGALKRNVIWQFLGESLIFTLLALIPACILIKLFLPLFNEVSGKELTFNLWNNWSLFSGLFLVTIVTGLLAGSYPAFFLSAFNPTKILKGNLSAASNSASFRKIFVVIQFALSVILMIGTAIVYYQLDYMKNLNPGFQKEQLLYIYLKGDTRRFYKPLKSELGKNPGILAVTGSQQNPAHIGNNSGGADWDGKNPDQNVYLAYNVVDFNFIRTLKIDMLAGRTFSPEFSTDQTEAFVINEEAAKLLGMESAVGANFSFIGRSGKIIGVMKNFHFKSIRQKIEPLALLIGPQNENVIESIILRLSPENMAASIDFLKTTWARTVPNYPLEYKFVDEDFDKMYKAEERMGSLLKYFSAMAIFIACLGLFGLAAFTAEQRTKEIGIRKVLGASVSGMVWLLIKEFTRWVAIANILAWPVAWLAMRSWLQNFAYRIDLGIFIFLGAGMLALLIAILTVSFQALKAAVASPVEALRYE